MTREVAESTARDLSLILDSDEFTHGMMREAAMRGITEGSGTYSDTDALLSAYKDRRYEFVGPVALYLADELYGVLELAEKPYDERTLLERLFSAVVDYNDSDLWREMADLYMPDPDDLAEWIEEYEPEEDPDPLADIPWGTPDEWIPDNPDENGMRQSDFI